jgi:hypothetical protein
MAHRIFWDSIGTQPARSVRSLSLPELGLARVRHLKWPKSGKPDFGWEREPAEFVARAGPPHTNRHQ